jgi:hypothetical protein
MAKPGVASPADPASPGAKAAMASAAAAKKMLQGMDLEALAQHAAADHPTGVAGTAVLLCRAVLTHASAFTLAQSELAEHLAPAWQLAAVSAAARELGLAAPSEGAAGAVTVRMPSTPAGLLTARAKAVALAGSWFSRSLGQGPDHYRVRCARHR